MFEREAPEPGSASERPAQDEPPPLARVKPRARLSPIWILPVVALGLVGYLAYAALANRGPTVTLSLATADGLAVDQTQVKHKAVTVGTVESIKLTKDMKSVVVRLRMEGGTDAMLTDHARFWVVRPRLSAGALTGIETLVTGAYIEVDPGEPGGKKQRDFTALSQPPGRQSDEPGRMFVLHAKRIGSLSVGSPLFYRDVEVGQLVSYELGDGQGPVVLHVFVRDPFDQFVHTQTRFWNASGISLTTGASGLRLEMQSMQALLSGGIAFETPMAHEPGEVAPESTLFDLYEDKVAADSALFREKIPYVTYFRTSVQGLLPGAPVHLAGVPVGSVSDVKLAYDGAAHALVARVAFDLQPERVLKKDVDGPQPSLDDVRAALSNTAMRVTLEASNFLTGGKDLSVEYDDKGPPADLPREGDAIVLPSRGGGLDGLTASLADVASKIDKIPFEEIGDNANATLAKAERLVTDIDTNAAPALAQLPMIAAELSEAAKNARGALGSDGYGQNSEFQRGLARLLHEADDTARSVRTLADFLDRHPESLLRGRAGQGGR